MRHPTTHAFLKWAGPTLVIFIGACIGLTATIAQGFPDTRPWAERLFYQWWPIVTAAWFLVTSAVVICAYIWALIWTGQTPTKKPGILLMGEGIDHVRVEYGSGSSGPIETRFVPIESSQRSGLILWIVQKIRNVFHKRRQAETTPGASLRADQSREWISFHRALHYLVYDSAWGATQPAVSSEEEFNAVVCAEVRERLARGEIAARGWRGWDDEKSVPRATDTIAAEFWVDAYFLPWGEIALAKDNRGVACKRGGSGEQWRGIILCGDDVRKVWPPRTNGRTGLTPLSAMIEDLRATCERGNAELAAQQAAKVASQRARSQQARDLAAALDDELKEQDELTRLRLAAVLSSARSADVATGYRNVTLAQAFAYILNGQWEKSFSATLLAGHEGHGEAAEQFRQKAFEGSLTVWGKHSSSKLFEKIPREHWRDHAIRLTDLIGPTFPGGAEPYRELMLNRAEVETEWPHEG